MLASQLAGLVVVAGNAPSRAGSLTALVVITPGPSSSARAAQMPALVVYAKESFTVSRASQLTALAVYGTGTGVPERSRAWSFTFDGHTFYVLDLGTEGTFLYDMVTGQWSQFQTAGFSTWNMHAGTTWGEGRVAGGDALGGFVWELNPDMTVDEGFRSLTHIVTGGLATRSRVRLAVESLRLTASVGQNTDSLGATVSLRWSDDLGKTWSAYQTISLTSSNFNGEIAWRSLGSFAAPGRVFEISDTGGMVRIDGTDAGINDFDEDGA